LRQILKFALLLLLLLLVWAGAALFELFNEEDPQQRIRARLQNVEGDAALEQLLLDYDEVGDGYITPDEPHAGLLYSAYYAVPRHRRRINAWILQRFPALRPGARLGMAKRMWTGESRVKDFLRRYREASDRDERDVWVALLQPHLKRPDVQEIFLEELMVEPWPTLYLIRDWILRDKQQLPRAFRAELERLKSSVQGAEKLTYHDERMVRDIDEFLQAP